MERRMEVVGMEGLGKTRIESLTNDIIITDSIDVSFSLAWKWKNDIQHRTKVEVRMARDLFLQSCIYEYAFSSAIGLL